MNKSLGYFGNIWVRQNYLAKAGDVSKGHKHLFDHVSILSRGKVKVEVEGLEPKEFTAPTFIMIKKEYSHVFTALEDDTVWFCVYAVRTIDGEVIEEDFYGHENSMHYGHEERVTDKLDFWPKIEIFHKKTTIESDNN